MIDPLIHSQIITRLLVSFVLGGAIGLEREIHKSHAGLRTHTLVCLGSALFTLASYQFQGPSVDISRIAAQVVVGIGFLGGGVIFKSKDQVFGLTTAASLWITAGIGLTVGFGDYFTAILATFLALIIIILGRLFEKRVLDKAKRE